MKKIIFFLAFLILTGSILQSCRKEDSCEGCINGNKPPVANAGTDVSIALPLDSVQLDGSASYDADGNITNYQWSKISGHSSFNISSSSSARTIVKNLIAGIYLFELKVTDNKGLTTKDTTQVLVTDPSQPNQPPVANAGPDKTITLPNNTVTLDGTGSTDPDNNITSYLWTKISGPTSFHIVNANAAQTQVNNLVQGAYQFELIITDAGSLSSKDTMQVIVFTENNACNINNRPIIQAHLHPIGNLSIGRINIITAAANNKILFAGGSSYIIDSTGVPTRRVDIYDINSNSWSIKDLVAYPPWRLDMGITTLHNKIFIAGGGFWGDDLYTNRIDIYNASDNSWTSASLSEYRTATTGVSSQNKVFFAGGYFYSSADYWSNKVDIYDLTTDLWTTDTLTERRGYLSAAAAGNKIYFAGGQKNNGQLLLSDKIDEYDMLSDSWSISTLQEPLAFIGTISAANKVFFAGGQTMNGESGRVEIRDVVTNATSFACIIPRAGLTAVTKDDKIVFFTGYGSDPRNGTHFEIYNLTTNTWCTGVLDKSINGAAIISVNNVIYVAGGFVNGQGSDKVWKLEF